MVNYPSWNQHTYKPEGEKDIFVYAAYVPPGKHTYMVKDCCLKDFDQIYFLKTIVGLKKTEHTPRQIENTYKPIKELEMMPRNTRKFTKTKIMKLFQVDANTENLFPDLQTAMQKKECMMDEYTLSATNKWLKDKSGKEIPESQCGSDECRKENTFNIELQTLKTLWGQLLNIESIRAHNSSFPYMSMEDFRRLIKDLGLDQKTLKADDID